MVQSGDWITPQIYGAPQFEKPIFYYWLVAGSFKALVIGFAIFQCVVVGLFAAIALSDMVPALSLTWPSGKLASVAKTLRPFEVPVQMVFACLVVSLILRLRKNLRVWLLASSTAGLALIVGALTTALPAVEAESSARPVALKMLQERQGDEQMITSKFLARGIIFYTHSDMADPNSKLRILAKKEQPFWAAHPLPVIVWKKGLRDFLKEHPSAISTLRKADWQTFALEPGFAGSEPLAEIGENVVVRALTPKPEVSKPAAPVPEPAK